jgi:hydrogenase/urease accessory protein HupE
MSAGIGARAVPRARLAALAGGLALGGYPFSAEAHLVTTGLGPLYDGVLHFILTPEDLVPALALALLAGLRGAPHGRRALSVLPAWLLGGVIGLGSAGPVASGGPGSIATSLSFVLLGALVAVDARLPLPAMTALAALLGLVHG